MNELKICLWNANGLSQHRLEIEKFLTEQNIDIMLISETHFTEKNNFKINDYQIYDTKHPSGKAHGGSAILIKNRIKHFQMEGFSEDYIQATSICLSEWNGNCIISSMYSPPKHTINAQQYSDFFNKIGNKFIIGGDYNAKHKYWGSRLTTTKGKQLLEAINQNNLDTLSTGHPTYWPTDKRKIPDLIDFFVLKGISKYNTRIQNSYDLSSDHSPIILYLTTSTLKTGSNDCITNKYTKWPLYNQLMKKNCNLNLKLQTSKDIDDGLDFFTKTMIESAKKATPSTNNNHRKKGISYSILQLLKEKRNLRRQWQLHRSPILKSKLNKSIKVLKEALIEEREGEVQKYLSELTATELTEYSLWKATKKLKRPQTTHPPIRLPNGEWARSDEDKAETFAHHLEQVFKINETDSEFFPSNNTESTSKYQKLKFKINNIKNIIDNVINIKKAPGMDQITGQMLKKLPENCIKFIVYVFNAIMRTGYYPQKWKISQIIMIPKPGKEPTQVSSYRPISLLPILSKLFEKVLANKIKLHLDEIIPKTQFGFREEHGTVEQIHRIVNEIKIALDTKQFCSAVFLDIAQAFDKVWHEGLIHKIKVLLPPCFHKILTNYLLNRKFLVKYKSALSNSYNIRAGVPQGSVLGPILYLIFTADMPSPSSKSMIISTFADDTAVLSTNKNFQTASRDLQEYLLELQEYFKKWKIKVNEVKSQHITFTLKKQTCPTVKLNDISMTQTKEIKYLGLHLDRRLTWKKHVNTKRQQMKLKFAQMHWLLRPNSKLSLECKVLLYKSIIMPIWTYGIQLWGSTCASNVDIIQRTQSKMLREIANAPWYIRNKTIHNDLEIAPVTDVIKNFSTKYRSKLQNHPNELARNLLINRRYQRLQRIDPLDLADTLQQ